MPDYYPLFLVTFFIGGLIQGLTGFGFGLIVIPLMILYLTPQEAVPIALIHGTILPLILLFDTWRNLEIRRILPLIVAGICGLPAGTYILKAVSPDPLKIMIGIIIVGFGLAFLSGYQRKVKRERFAFIPIGLISGMLNSSTALSGPPIILFFANQGLPKETFRANIVGYFIVLNLSTYPFFIANGILNASTVISATILLPGMLLGVFTGIKLVTKVNEIQFRRIALSVVTVAGLVSLLSGIGIIR